MVVSLPKHLITVAMKIHCAQAVQPLGDMQVPVLTGFPKRQQIILGMNVHAHQAMQPLGDFQMPEQASPPKRHATESINVHDAEPVQPLGDLQVNANWKPFAGTASTASEAKICLAPSRSPRSHAFNNDCIA